MCKPRIFHSHTGLTQTEYRTANIQIKNGMFNVHCYCVYKWFTNIHWAVEINSLSVVFVSTWNLYSLILCFFFSSASILLKTNKTDGKYAQTHAQCLIDKDKQNFSHLFDDIHMCSCIRHSFVAETIIILFLIQMTRITIIMNFRNVKRSLFLKLKYFHVKFWIDNSQSSKCPGICSKLNFWRNLIFALRLIIICKHAFHLQLFVYFDMNYDDVIFFQSLTDFNKGIHIADTYK